MYSRDKELEEDRKAVATSILVFLAEKKAKKYGAPSAAEFNELCKPCMFRKYCRYDDIYQGCPSGFPKSQS